MHGLSPPECVVAAMAGVVQTILECPPHTVQYRISDRPYHSGISKKGNGHGSAAYALLPRPGTGAKRQPCGRAAAHGAAAPVAADTPDGGGPRCGTVRAHIPGHRADRGDRKSTRLNSSHSQIS